MSEPSAEQFAAAQRLGISLHFGNSPLAIAKLVELVESLQRRVDALEEQRRSVWRK
jgi:hypothetical protein